MAHIPIKKTVDRIPGGIMLIPMLSGALVTTFIPWFPYYFGSFTSALLTDPVPVLAVFYVCIGATIKIKAAPTILKRGGIFLVTKASIALIIGMVLARVIGPTHITSGVLSGVSVLAVVAALNNTNGGLYMALMEQYGSKEDTGAYSIMSLESGPFLTMLTLGIVGLSAFPWQTLIGSILPLAAGMLLGNLDHEMRKFLGQAVPVMIPFFSLALGASLDLSQVWQAGLIGMLLGIAVVIVSGVPLYWVDRLSGGTGLAGVSAANTAGNAAAVPAIIAAANPTYAPAAQSATMLVAACVIVSSIVSPLLVAIIAKRQQSASTRARDLHD
ncbi:2-keto-3-deoxygluconate permease [Carnimonas bestiolae]|uniref:2-keto-3-deoxygluconate permease n=1 Tax=Carnimonas bestiolae TaxID=3402172 RepID=UPI003EDC438F